MGNARQISYKQVFVNSVGVNFFNVYLVLREREAGHEWERGREMETQNLKQAPGSKLLAQSLTQGSNS